MPQRAHSKPVIAVDFDETLVDHAFDITRAYNQQYNLNSDNKVRVEDTFAVFKLGDPERGWHHDRAQAIEWISHYLESEEAQKTPPLDGSQEVLGRLKEHFELHIVTGRWRNMRAATEPWVERHFPDVFTGIHFAGDHPKSVTCRHIGASVLVDDFPMYIADIASAGLHGILFGDYPWNKHERLLPDVQRAKNWYDTEELLYRLWD